MAFLACQERDLLGQNLDLGVAQVLQPVVASHDDLADLAHPGRFLEDDIAAGQGQKRGDAERAVLDVGHRLHVRDRGDLVGDAVGGGIESAGAIDLEEEEVDLLLPRLIDSP